MDSKRASAVVMAVIAAMLVIMAGKGCTNSIDKRNKQMNKTSQTQAYNGKGAYNGGGNAGMYYGGLSPTPPSATDAESVTAVDSAEGGVIYIDVTDADGNVSATVPYVPQNVDETMNAPDPTKSVLEQYEEDKEKNRQNKISGYNHQDNTSAANQYKYDIKDATFPEDFAIVIG